MRYVNINLGDRVAWDENLNDHGTVTKIGDTFADYVGSVMVRWDDGETHEMLSNELLPAVSNRWEAPCESN